MNIQTMIYIYIAICVCMIIFNCVYVFVLRRSAKRLEKRSERLHRRIEVQLSRREDGMEVTDSHKRYLKRRLRRTSGLSAFDKCMERLVGENPTSAREYLWEIYPVFMYLSKKYLGRDSIKSAYFPYIIAKYELLSHEDSEPIVDAMFGLLFSENIYCRENALAALYTMRDPNAVVQAMKIIDRTGSFHHPKLICDGMLTYHGDIAELGNALLDRFEDYSVNMQLNILNFIRFAGVRRDDMMLELIMSEERDRELRFACIRYFEKHPDMRVLGLLHEFADGRSEREWEYQSIATAALKSYPCDETARILKQNLASSNWYIRLNAAISCERLGYSYSDMISIFDGGDRYAREILQYRFDRREAQKEAAGVC